MGTQMANQFDLEQGIMNAWMVTSDLDVLLEELVENDAFTKDQASNFVLGLSTIYEAKFDKLFRTFEDFLKTYYTVSRELKQTQQELRDLRDEMEAAEEANLELADALAQEHEGKTLEELFLEEEQKSYEQAMEENDRLDFFMEDEHGYFIFPK
jgi:hypothetical protein